MLLFMVSIFRLKKIVILMNKSNKTVEQVKKEIKTHQILSFSFYLFFIADKTYLLYTNSLTKIDPSNLQVEVKFSMGISVIAFVIFLLVDFYLIDMVLVLQKLFRKYGHTKGYFSDLFIIINYVLYVGQPIFWLVDTTIFFYVVTRDYECNEFDRKFYQFT